MNNNKKIIASIDNSPVGSDVFFETQDIDWFMTDMVGNIAVFATGGCGFIPDSVKKNLVKMDSFLSHLSEFPDVSEVTFFDDNLPSFATEKRKVRYLNAHGRLAKKGIFCYDVKSMIGSSVGYKLISIPTQPIKIDVVPDTFRNILSLAKVEKSIFVDLNEIDSFPILV